MFLFQFKQFFEVSCLYRLIVFNFRRNFGCRKPEFVTLLFWLYFSGKFDQVGSQVRITFQNYAEKCHIHLFNEFDLFRCDYGKFSSLYASFDRIRCFCCCFYSHCLIPFSYCWPWFWNQQTGCFRKLFQRCRSNCSIPFWGMVNKSCDCFCCLWWHCQDVVS